MESPLYGSGCGGSSSHMPISYFSSGEREALVPIEDETPLARVLAESQRASAKSSFYSKHSAVDLGDLVDADAVDEDVVDELFPERSC